MESTGPQRQWLEELMMKRIDARWAYQRKNPFWMQIVPFSESKGE